MGNRGKAGSASSDLGDLLRRIAAGDREAFAELFLILAPRIKAYLIRLGSDAVSAEDLSQDVMVTIWHKAGQFDPQRASVMTWAFVIARNRRIDSLCRESSSVTYGHVPPDGEDETARSDELVAGWQDDARIRQAVASLPDDQREVIVRSYFEEQPHSAIAQALGLPLGTVKSRLRIAFMKLRSRMEDSQ